MLLANPFTQEEEQLTLMFNRLPNYRRTQFELLTLLGAHGRITIVGDRDQVKFPPLLLYSQLLIYTLAQLITYT